ncbi:MAG: integrase arm-type DNA-binding domain-containing protein [Allopontixanthobacter sediminis]
MGRALHKLSAKEVEKLKTPGWHGDGGGLWLRIFNDGTKRWVFTWERNKRRREMGLGPVSNVALAKAREKAEAARALLADGLDPLEVRRAAEEEEAAKAEEEKRARITAPLFGAFADSYIDNHEDGWKNPKHRQQWRNTIKTHAEALLMMPVNEIAADDVVAVLRPIWRSTPETAGRLRGRIENILDAAKASKHIASPWENPARWKGNLIHLLPRRKKKSQVRHHPAMPFEHLPAFMQRLRLRPALAARALEITILCATRTNETLRATWSEIDLDERVWTVPGERMKMGVEHRIPLPDHALRIFQDLAKGSNCDPAAYVFAGQKMGKPLSQMSMTMVLRRMKLGHYTVHGMRSGFRDYMGDMTAHPESIVEQALAHQIGDETTRAYRRGDAFLKRQKLMNDWASYLYASKRGKRRGSPGAVVAELAAAA